MFEKIKNIPRKNIFIAVLLIVFILIPIVLTVIFMTTSKDVPAPTEENAFSTTSDDKIVETLKQQGNIDMNGSVVHTIAADGDWIAVMVFSVKADDYGNNMLAILQQKGNQYTIKYIGTGCEKTCLREIGAPSGLVSQLSNTNNNGKQYMDIINNSQKNPRNKYSLLKKLPYKSDNLNITYSFESGEKDQEGIFIPTIIVTGTNDTQRALALEKISTFGYDPGDYKIVFKYFTNPFTGGNK